MSPSVAQKLGVALGLFAEVCSQEGGHSRARSSAPLGKSHMWVATGIENELATLGCGFNSRIAIWMMTRFAQEWAQSLKTPFSLIQCSRPATKHCSARA